VNAVPTCWVRLCPFPSVSFAVILPRPLPSPPLLPLSSRTSPVLDCLVSFWFFFFDRSKKLHEQVTYGITPLVTPNDSGVRDQDHELITPDHET
jgi:hypothetical protein